MVVQYILGVCIEWDGGVLLIGREEREMILFLGFVWELFLGELIIEEEGCNKLRTQGVNYYL